MESYQKKSKSQEILQELLYMLRTQDPLLKNGFFSRQDLSNRYHIAPATAQRILKTLEKKGYILCRKGCRAKIQTSIQKPVFSRKKKILLLFSGKNQTEISNNSTCQYMLNILRTLLENLGCMVLPGFYRHDLCPDDWAPYDGIIALLPLENFPNLQYSLILSGKAYAGLSVKQSLPNTVFIQMQTGLLEMSYYLFNQRICSLSIPRVDQCCRWERQMYLQWLQRLREELSRLGHELSVTEMSHDPTGNPGDNLSIEIHGKNAFEHEKPYPLPRQNIQILPDSIFSPEQQITFIDLGLSDLCTKLSSLLLLQFSGKHQAQIKLHECRFYGDPV